MTRSWSEELRALVASGRSPEGLGRAYEGWLREDTAEVGRRARKLEGIYYTPDPIVDHLVDVALRPLWAPGSRARFGTVRIVDPACGAGSVLVGALRGLLRWYEVRNKGPLTPAVKLRVARDHLFGVDVDPHAVETARTALALCVGESDPARFAANVRCGDALVDESFDWRREFVSVFARSNPGFDAVVGNPPYVDAEWMTAHRPRQREYCAGRFATARGNWDLYCVFVERAVELLRDGGLHAFVVPNKIGSAPYATAVRRLMVAGNTLLGIRDYSAVSPFGAAVYPIVYCLKRSDPPDGSHGVSYERMCGPAAAPTAAESRNLQYDRNFPEDGSPWPIFAGADGSSLLEPLSSLPRLEDVAQVWGAATVAEAYDLAAILDTKETPEPGDLKVVNSGTIDPFRTLWAQRPMRYLRRSVSHPVVEARDLDRLPPRRLAQARSPKVVVAGMTRSLECVHDEAGGLLAAKSTCVVVPRRDLSVVYLAALLNSRLMTRVYRAMFGGLTMDGGYLRVGPPQLRQLPIVVPRSRRQRELAAELVERVGAAVQGRLDIARIDAIVETLYGQSARSTPMP